MSNTFFYERTVEPERSNNLVESFQEPDVLHESVNAIRRDLDSFSFSGGTENPNKDDLESNGLIPSVLLFDSSDGKSEDEPHFVGGEELLKSTETGLKRDASTVMGQFGDRERERLLLDDLEHPSLNAGFSEEEQRERARPGTCMLEIISDHFRYRECEIWSGGERPQVGSYEEYRRSRGGDFGDRDPNSSHRNRY